MKKILAFLLIMSFGFFSGTVFGQDKKNQEKKGGFSVGGYDNTRQEEKSTVTKRSVVIPEEAAPGDKAAEEAMPAPAPAPAMAPPPPPAAEAKSAKDAQGNAYGKDKEGMEGKEFGQARAQDAKSKQKAKKNKSKGKSK